MMIMFDIVFLNCDIWRCMGPFTHVHHRLSWWMQYDVWH